MGLQELLDSCLLLQEALRILFPELLSGEGVGCGDACNAGTRAANFLLEETVV